MTVFHGRGCYIVWSFNTRDATLCRLSRLGVLHCVVFQDWDATLCGLSTQGATLCGLSRLGVLHCVVFQDWGCYTESFIAGGATLCGLSRLTVPVFEDRG